MLKTNSFVRQEHRIHENRFSFFQNCCYVFFVGDFIQSEGEFHDLNSNEKQQWK